MITYLKGQRVFIFMKLAILVHQPSVTRYLLAPQCAQLFLRFCGLVGDLGVRQERRSLELQHHDDTAARRVHRGPALTQASYWSTISPILYPPHSGLVLLVLLLRSSPNPSFSTPRSSFSFALLLRHRAAQPLLEVCARLRFGPRARSWYWCGAILAHELVGDFESFSNVCAQDGELGSYCRMRGP